ncbi:MAG: hypothetical protein Q7R90_01300 [bacterium]|nr:hypothetical protein [bacterium]
MTTEISSHVRASEILALQASRYPWFQQIADIWKQRTKQDPVDVALAMHLADMRRRNWDRICWFAGGACVALFVVNSIITFNIYERTAPPDLLMASLLGGPLVVMVAVATFQMQFIWRRMPYGRQLYNDSGWGIQDRLTTFFDLVSHGPDFYNYCLIDDLRRDARWQLILLAQDVVLLEHIPREKREKGWGKTWDDARKKTSFIHQQLKDIGLANETYDEYYHAAERRVAEIEAAD